MSWPHGDAMERSAFKWASIAEILTVHIVSSSGVLDGYSELKVEVVSHRASAVFCSERVLHLAIYLCSVSLDWKGCLTAVLSHAISRLFSVCI